MSFDYIYSLHNIIDGNDNIYVQQVLKHIKTTIEDKISLDINATNVTINLTEFEFKNDEEQVIIVDKIQLERVKNKLIEVLRKNGLRVPTNYFSPYNTNNLNNSNDVLLYIEWIVRTNGEFMKTYY